MNWHGFGVTDSTAKADFKNNGNSDREKGNFSQVLQQLHISAAIKKKPNSTCRVVLLIIPMANMDSIFLISLYIPAPGSLLELPYPFQLLGRFAGL